MNRTVALVDSGASHSWRSPTVGAIAHSDPPDAESQSGVSGVRPAGQIPTSVRLYPGGGLSWLPLVTDIRRIVEAGASWEHPIVHSDIQRRLCLVASISIIRGDAAGDREWRAVRCVRHFVFQSQTTAGPRNNLG
jgi:hypothetical protein